MDESEIAKRLADSVPKDEPLLNGYPEDTKPAGEENFLDKTPGESEIARSQILDYLGVPTAERYSPEVSHWINEVYAWARDNAQSGDALQLMRVINEQELHMGSKLKPGRLVRLYNYVKIAKMRKDLAEKERLLYG